MTVPIIVPAGGGASGVVIDAYQKWSAIAAQAYAKAQELAGQMGDVSITPVTFDASFNPQIALGAFPTLSAPPVPTADLQFHVPAGLPAPPALDPVTYQPTAAPSDAPQAPAYLPPAPPQIGALSAPGDAPTVVAPDMPVPPDYVLPAPPSLAALQMPDLPALDVPVFAATVPALNIPFPDENFSFTPQAYADSLLDQTKSVLSAMMSGDFVLPTAAVEAIRARAQTAAFIEEGRLVDQAYNEIAARGFNEEPNGLLNQRVTIARDTALKMRAEANRDVYIQDQTVAKENLREAVRSGIQLEGSLIQLRISETQLQFDAAKYALDVAIQVFQARISLYNASLQGFTAEAAVFRDRISALQAQAQAYLAEMEGVRAQGELNMQQVSLYNAQLEGVRTMVGVYTAQIQAAEVQSRVSLAAVQAYGAKVQAFGAEVSAQNAQWMGYKTQVDAQLGAAQFYQTSMNGFSARIQAWATGEQGRQNAARFKLEEGKMSLEQWHAQLESFDAQLKTELTRVQAVAQAFGSQVDIYKANAQVADAAAQFDERRFQLNLAQEQAIVDTSLKRSEASFEQVKYITTLMVEIKRTLATVESQLAASAMNAVNIGAQLSTADNQSVDWSTNVSLSGSVDDV